jgi:hypothetical protein
MLGLLVLALSTQAAAADRPRLVVQEISAGQGVDAAVARSFSTSLARELERRGVHEVVSAQDVVSLLGAERERQLLGCSDESMSCLTELAGAVNARFVVSGSLVRLGSAWQLSLQTVDTGTSRATGRAIRMAREAEELVDNWSFTVAEAVGLPAPEQPSRLAPATLVGVGAAAAIGGGIVLVLSIFREAELATELRLADSNPSVLRPAAAYDAEASAIGVQRWIGAGLAAAGVALAAVGIVWFARAGAPRAQLAVLPSPSGGIVVIAGAWP